MLEILGEVIEEPVLSEIQSSKAIALEIDESTDVPTARQLDVHVPYGSRISSKSYRSWVIYVNPYYFALSQIPG